MALAFGSSCLRRIGVRLEDCVEHRQSASAATLVAKNDKQPVFPQWAFLSRCELNTPAATAGEDCVNDMVHMIPGWLFPLFHSWLFAESYFPDPLGAAMTKLLRRHQCFGASRPNAQGFRSGNGHFCAVGLPEALQLYTNGWREDYGFLSKWRPEEGQLLRPRSPEKAVSNPTDLWQIA